MSDAVGRDVLIPADAWVPPLEGAVEGYVVKLTAPSVRFPNGRYEVQATKGPPSFDTKLRYVWPAEQFDAAWLLDTRTRAPASLAKKGARTPSRSRAAAAAAAAASAPTSVPEHAATTPGRGRTPSRGRAAAAASPAGPSSLDEAFAATETAEETPGRPSSRSPSGSGGRRSPRSPRGKAAATTPAHEAAAAAQRTPSAATTATKSLLRNPARTPSGNRVTFKDVPATPRRVTVVPRISGWANLANFLLFVAVGLPAVLLAQQVIIADPTKGPLALPLDLDLSKPWDQVLRALWPDVATLQWWQRLGLHHPLLFVNLVFFLNVDVLFWVISRLQQSTWLIDPYWTVVPVLIQLFFQLHPLARTDRWRGIIAPAILRLWSVRLTHNYFRREDWQFGAREDPRYADMARQYGKHWWWLSFFLGYLSQHAMLVGLSLPFYPVHTSAAPWLPLDTVATVLALAGLAIAWVADNQLDAFMARNRLRVEAGLAPVLLLDTGIWHYSRHPNHFGEQLFWWGVALYGVRLGQAWTVVGTLFNSLCMVGVTQLNEARMLERPERAALWREYQRTTSVWVPWFKRK